MPYFWEGFKIGKTYINEQDEPIANTADVQVQLSMGLVKGNIPKRSGEVWE